MELLVRAFPRGNGILPDHKGNVLQAGCHRYGSNEARNLSENVSMKVKELNVSTQRDRQCSSNQVATLPQGWQAASAAW